MVAMPAIRKKSATIRKSETQMPTTPGERMPLSEEPSTQEQLNKRLISAANTGMLSKVQKLVDDGADPNHKNSVGMRAVDCARIHDYYRVVEFLEKEMKK